MATYGYTNVTVNDWMYWNRNQTKYAWTSNWINTTAINATATTYVNAGYTFTASTAATTTGVWINWNEALANAELYTQAFARPVETDEEREARVARERQLRAEADERLAHERHDREVAVQRAETMLHENLRPGQRRMLRQHSRFYVRSQLGNRYEIQRGHHGNVFKVDSKGKRTESLCVYPTGGLPEGDVMLGQMLHLQYNEEAFRKTAHISQLQNGQNPLAGIRQPAAV